MLKCGFESKLQSNGYGYDNCTKLEYLWIRGARWSKWGAEIILEEVSTRKGKASFIRLSLVKFSASLGLNGNWSFGPVDEKATSSQISDHLVTVWNCDKSLRSAYAILGWPWHLQLQKQQLTYWKFQSLQLIFYFRSKSKRFQNQVSECSVDATRYPWRKMSTNFEV